GRAEGNGIYVSGPSRRRSGPKADHAWMVRRITNPHEFRPRTRMPSFMFTPEQAEKITAYLLSTTKEPSARWLEAHPDPAIATNDDLAQQGRKLMDTLGCRACHALAPDEVAGQLGANKDIAPNLSQIAAKTYARRIDHCS